MSALAFFKEHCFTKLIEHLRGALLNLITKDRDGQHVDWTLLKNCIAVFVHMGLNNADIVKVEDDAQIWKGDKNLQVYETEFEKHLLQRSKDEYNQKSTGWLMSLNCPEYLRETEKNLLKEEERANYFLQPETKQKLLNVIQQEIIEKQA